MEREDTRIYKIRDSVDVYTIHDEILYFYFINTRISKQYRVSKETIALIQLIDGESTIAELAKKYSFTQSRPISTESILHVLQFLERENIVTLINQTLVPPKLSVRYDRQINFLEELSLGSDSGLKNQKRIQEQTILVFGVGAVGGDIALQLAMAGCGKFILVDNALVTASCKCRHLYYREQYVGLPKVEALKREIQAIDPAIQVETYLFQVNPDTNLSELIRKATFIINTADEPYIGFTSLKISRECCRQKKPLYIAGGFDIHCMSTGELIIPGLTPCSDCYSNYFHKKLESWLPLPKAVVDTHNEYGGFSAQSIFSASFACMEIIKFICNFANGKSLFLTRGEMDMEDYSIHYIDIKKDPNCNICGGITYEPQD